MDTTFPHLSLVIDYYGFLLALVHNKDLRISIKRVIIMISHMSAMFLVVLFFTSATCFRIFIGVG